MLSVKRTSFRIVIFILIVGKIRVCNGCGVSTHIEIGHMAATIFNDKSRSISYKELIVKHQDAFQAGNTYPDTYFTSLCYQNKYHDVSEDTHWTPFTNVTISYIRDNFPPPWSEETEKLIVFLLGVVTHQVADITWHSLGIRQGFIRTMAAVDFHGVYDTSHSAADFGGDVINEYRGDYSYVHANQWYIPVDHLAKIYMIYYGQLVMPANVIEECTTLIYLAVLGEKLALREVYEETAVKSPFLTQNLDSFFLGGMYDMALWSTSIWDNVLTILENGFGKNCTTPENPLYIRCSGSAGHMTAPKGIIGMSPAAEIIRQHALPADSITMERTQHGVIFRANTSVIQKLEAQAKRVKPGQGQGEKSSKVVYPNTILSTNKPYSRLGRTILSADVNNDGIDDLLVSAPMYSANESTDYEGRVFIIYGRASGIPKGDFSIEDVANVTLHGADNSAGRFGSGLAVLDVNQDGYNDVIVSSPNIGWTTLKYTGGMSVWYGNSDGKFSDSPSLTHRPVNPPLYNNEGVNLFTEDVNGDGHEDLIVGSPYSPGSPGPQTGKLCVMLSRTEFNFDTFKCIYGPGRGSNTSWFGTSVTSANIPGAGRVLVVGSPYFRKCALGSCKFSANDTQSVGQVTIWSLPDLKLLKTLSGSNEHEHFGSSLSVGYPAGSGSAVLAVGADSVDVKGSVAGLEDYSQLGSVTLYNLSTLMSSPSPAPIDVLYGAREFSMFGSQSMFADLDRDGRSELLVGSPHFTWDPTRLIYGAEHGIVHLFKVGGNSLTSEGRNETSCTKNKLGICEEKMVSLVELRWDEDKAHLGGRLAVLNTSPKRSGKTQISVSALRSSHGAHRSGTVLIY